jgi:hypothetical protein
MLALGLVVALSCLLGQADAASTPAVPDLEGTTWYSEEKSPTRYEFRSGGVLAYTKAETYTNGTWKQDGASLYFETNHRSREARGRWTGQAFELEWVKGQIGHLRLTREPQPPPAPPEDPPTLGN